MFVVIDRQWKRAMACSKVVTTWNDFAEIRRHITLFLTHSIRVQV